MQRVTARGFSDVGWRSVGRFVLIFAAVWLTLDSLYDGLPLVRPGSDIVYEAKFERLARARLFAAGDRNRIMIFGNSRTMAGFRPDVFDAAIGPGTRSVNMGLPGEGRFLPLLEAALASGNVPTQVLLTVPWDGATAPPGLYDRLLDDAAIADRLVPFRHFVRDVAVFLFQNRTQLVAGYRAAAGERERMLAQRGWYFIRSQSHYAGDRLPDDYRLPTDRPDLPDIRALPRRSLVRARLEELARQYGFKVVFVPSYARQGEVAPPPAAESRRVEIVSEAPLIEVVGPDDWLYPAGRFADPVHLNPDGARLYTQELAGLLKDLDIVR